MTKKQNSALKSYTRSFYAKNKLNFTVAFVMIILYGLISLALAYLIGSVLNAMTSGSLDALAGLILPIALLTVGILVTNLLDRFFRGRFIHQGLAQYKETIFNGLTLKNISAFSKENTSRYLSLLTNDANSMEQNYLNSVLLLAYNVVVFFGALILMFYLSWELALLSIGICMVPMACSMFLGEKITKEERNVSDQNELFVAQTRDFLAGFSVVKGFKAERQARETFAHTNRKVEGMKRQRRWLESVLTSIADFSGYTMQAAVFFVGSYLALTQRATPGAMLSVVSLSNFVFQPIQVIPQYLAGIKACKGLIEKVCKVSEENVSTAGEKLPKTLTQGIEFSDVSFGYEENTPVLHHIDARFDLGKTYAVVGGSGSGKSTLLKLLMGGLGNYSGSIRMNGMELRSIDTDSLYNAISTIEQSTFIFDASIQDNITMFQSFPAEKIEAAVAQSGLSQLVAEKGLCYACGENGVNLSGGERQRVSIARCLLRGTPILMLDEATASLDRKTAFEVTNSILQLPELTRIVVTHTLDKALLQQFDEILVIKGGNIVEQGSFDDLMLQKDYFYSLYTVYSV